VAPFFPNGSSYLSRFKKRFGGIFPFRINPVSSMCPSNSRLIVIILSDITSRHRRIFRHQRCVKLPSTVWTKGGTIDLIVEVIPASFRASFPPSRVTFREPPPLPWPMLPAGKGVSVRDLSYSPSNPPSLARSCSKEYSKCFFLCLRGELLGRLPQFYSSRSSPLSSKDLPYD